MPELFIIAGPNGAGKTTAAKTIFKIAVKKSVSRILFMSVFFVRYSVICYKATLIFDDFNICVTLCVKSIYPI